MRQELLRIYINIKQTQENRLFVYFKLCRSIAPLYMYFSQYTQTPKYLTSIQLEQIPPLQ